MSEALSSTEIEDVLSSIRRLVSEELRPAARSATEGQPVVSGDKLMLTPALRVVAEQTASDAPMFTRHPRHDAGGIERVVSSLGAAVGPQSQEWEAETGDASPGFAESQPIDDWSLPDEAEAELAASLTPPQNFVFAESPAVDEVIVAADSAPEKIPGWAQQGDGPAVEEDPIEAAPAAGTIEPDMAWADAAEASVIAALSEAAFADEDPLLPEDDSLLFNEEVLRELVRDILREELAGKMGERITRNIRKLVRAEIARSFAAQQFE
jgi:hypothetical protein